MRAMCFPKRPFGLRVMTCKRVGGYSTTGNNAEPYIRALWELRKVRGGAVGSMPAQP